MPIKLTAKIEPKGLFTGLVDANQIIGTSGGRYESYLPSSTISGNSIHEYQLKISNEPVDGYYLQYKDSVDKLTWAEAGGSFDPTQYMTSSNIIANYPKSVQVLQKYYQSSLGKGISSQVYILSSWYNQSSQKLSDISGNLITKYLQSSVALVRYQDSSQALLKFPGSSTIIGRYAPSTLTYNRYLEYIGHSGSAIGRYYPSTLGRSLYDFSSNKGLYAPSSLAKLRYEEYIGHSGNLSIHYLSSNLKMWFDGVYSPTGTSFNAENYITSSNAINRFADSSSIQSKFILSHTYNASGAFYPSSLGKAMAGLSGGVKWLDLTDGGETTLHTHPGGGAGGTTYWNSQSNVSPGSIYYAGGDVVIGPSGTHYGDYRFQVSGETYFSGSVTFLGSLSGLSIPVYDSGAATKRYVDIISSNIVNRYNCGYARISSMGSIPHGLSSKPRYVSVEPSGLYVNFGMSCRVDETNIIVAFTAAGMRDIYWTASL